MRDDVGGPEATRPAPSREDVRRALALADGGPVTVGPLGFCVAQVLGVDTEGCRGSYDLRRRMSWPAYLSCLRRLTDAGEVVRKTRQDWHNLTGGAVFPDVGNSGTQAYATAETYDVLMGVGGLRMRGGSTEAATREMALHVARQRVLREHDALVQQYAAQWLEARADGGSGAGGVHGA